MLRLAGSVWSLLLENNHARSTTWEVKGDIASDTRGTEQLAQNLKPTSSYLGVGFISRKGPSLRKYDAATVRIRPALKPFIALQELNFWSGVWKVHFMKELQKIAFLGAQNKQLTGFKSNFFRFREVKHNYVWNFSNCATFALLLLHNSCPNI